MAGRRICSRESLQQAKSNATDTIRFICSWPDDRSSVTLLVGTSLAVQAVSVGKWEGLMRENGRSVTEEEYQDIRFPIPPKSTPPLPLSGPLWLRSVDSRYVVWRTGCAVVSGTKPSDTDCG